MPTATPADLLENRLTALLPERERNAFAPGFERTYLAPGTVLHEPNKPIAAVFFPINLAGSLVAVLADGTKSEVANIGNEGMVGLPVYLDDDRSPHLAIAQVPGDSLVMPAATFRTMMTRSRGLRPILHRYTQALFAQVAQTAACNQLHVIEQRCARWLLLTADRAGSNEFDLTHEYLALMLGVRRASVTVAAGALQKNGLIRYRHGHLEILDREGLRAASCDCYEAVNAEYDRLLAVTAE